MRRNAYLALVVGCLLVLTRVIDFAPPEKVRLTAEDAVRIVGDAPSQEFSATSDNEQSVQLRATLRLYPDAETAVGSPDPDVDATAQVLSQPVVTTLLGIEANVEQTVRLRNGNLVVRVVLQATPRANGVKRRGRRALTLERTLRVESRRRGFFDRAWRNRVHLDVQEVVTGVESGVRRLVFAVDDQLFALDVEVQRSRA
ncbi:MAG: hypothetical protein B7733_18320 [Myxococcales bacterium FL481]|nr:MAG: hypothetical protein B7733_18320 [Myxococcales bacterium FL481]